MEFVYICPSEAALTGLFVERYLYLAQHDKPVLKDVARDYIESFLPGFRRERRQRIEAAEIPGDVTFDKSENFGFVSIGHPKGYHDVQHRVEDDPPKVHYEVHDDGRVFRVTEEDICDCYTKKLITFLYGQELPESYAFDGDAWAEPADPCSVLPRLEELMRRFRGEHSFVIGLMFGKVCNAIADLDGEKIDLNDFVQQYETLAEKLLAIREIWANPVAASLLQGAPTGLTGLALSAHYKFNAERCEERPDGAEVDIDADEFGTELSEMECKIWAAWGSVLGAMRESDEEEHQQHVNDASHRLQKPRRLLTIKALVDQLDESTRQLTTGICKPKLAVLTLSTALELLVKQKWPRYAKSPDFNVSRILHEQLRSPMEADQRFARVAMTLHTTYRNPVIHEWDTFECTHQEAVFFLNGIRVLLELTGGDLRRTGSSSGPKA